MKPTGVIKNRSGNYKCDFCNHGTWKTQSGAENHVNNIHPKDLLIQQLAYENEKLKSEPPKVVEKEKIVYRDQPKPEHWIHSVFCTACREVIINALIPRGQTIEGTPHAVCGTKSLISIEKGIN